MSVERDAEILACEPFEGDKGDEPYKVLDDRMVVTRKAHLCAICLSEIPKGDRTRARKEVVWQKITTLRFCVACCDAMAEERTNPDALIDRYEVGNRRVFAR